MQGEFRMITDLAVAAPKELLFNYDELKAFLTEALRDYKTLVVTEDGISDAKAKRAKLNKLADNINSYRISVKKQLMEKYDEDFKPKCDELVAMTKEASDNIAAQIKHYEDEEKRQKIDALHSEYIALTDDEAESFCPWELVFNEKWANKGYRYEDAVEEIKAALYNTRVNLESIRSIGGDDVPYLLDVYKQTHDINLVLRKQLELQAAREREEKRKMEAERQATVVVEPKKKEAQAKKTEQVPAPTVVMEEPDDAVEEIGTTVFRVWCTRSQLNALGRFMRENGIQYGRA